MLVYGIIIGALGLYSILVSLCFRINAKEIQNLRKELAIYHAGERAAEEIHKQKGEKEYEISMVNKSVHESW